jgi:hypothetical protein
MRFPVVVFSVCISGTAWAGGDKVLVDPARAYADESSVWIASGNGGDGALIDAGAEIGGLQKGDRVRLDIKQGGKVVASETCELENRTLIDGLDGVKCSDRSKSFKKPGPLQADLIVESDADDKQYLVRTFNVNVKKWGNPDWQIDADDRLGAAYIVQNKDSKPLIRFWASAVADGSAPTLECKVDGKALPYIEGSWDTPHSIQADIIKGNNRTTWTWSDVKYELQTYEGDNFKPVELTKYPGAWDCLLRRYGVTLRQFKFTVDGKGKVQPHPMQSAKGGATLAPQVVQIDMVIPKGNGWDQRIKPDLIKKSRGFGMPWPQHDSVKTVLAALPPAYENATPKASQVTGSGKLIEGTKATPPRFTDESQTSLRLTKGQSGDYKGYGVSLSTAAVNITFKKGSEFRLDWKSKGKTVASIDCSWDRQLEEGKRVARYGSDKATSVSCDSENVNLKVAGPIEAQLIMRDDTDGNEYLLRTYKGTVVNPKSFGDPVWAILPDDTLGEGWMAGLHDGADHIVFRFWVATKENWPNVARCTVDGKKLPNDLLLSGGDSASIEYVVRKQGKDDQSYGWMLLSLDSSAGQEPSVGPGLPEKGEKLMDGKVQYLGQFPGNWDCDLRKDGKVWRKFQFSVNAKGQVEADPQFADELHTPDVAPVRVLFGKDAPDKRVRPDAIKKNAGWGRPWPKGPPKDLPAKASGLPDLK